MTNILVVTISLHFWSIGCRFIEPAYVEVHSRILSQMTGIDQCKMFCLMGLHGSFHPNCIASYPGVWEGLGMRLPNCTNNIEVLSCWLWQSKYENLYPWVHFNKAYNLLFTKVEHHQGQLSYACKSSFAARPWSSLESSTVYCGRYFCETKLQSLVGKIMAGAHTLQ